MTWAEILMENGISLAPAGHHHTRHGWDQFDCPWCSRSSHRWLMGYNQIYHYVNCWNCGSHGLVNTLAELLNIPTGQAFKLLEAIERREPKEKIEVRGKLNMPTQCKVMFESHRQYLKARGFDPEAIERIWDVSSVALSTTQNLHQKYCGRILIPIHLHGEVVSYTTRYVPPNAGTMGAKKKYMEYPYLSASPIDEKINHKKLLYGEDFCRHGISVHEGPLDAWAVGPGATCTFGLSYSKAQVARIAKYPIRVIAFDNEPKAQEVAKQLARDLAPFPGETYNVVFSEKDSSRSPRSEINEFRKRFELGEIE